MYFSIEFYEFTSGKRILKNFIKLFKIPFPQRKGEKRSLFDTSKVFFDRFTSIEKATFYKIF